MSKGMLYSPKSKDWETLLHLLSAGSLLFLWSWKQKCLEVTFQPKQFKFVAFLPVFDSSLVPPHSPELEEEQSSDGEDYPDGQAQREHDHEQGVDGEVDLGLGPSAVEVVPRPVEAVVECHWQNIGCLGATHHSEKEETDKVAVVEVANAVVDPWTVEKKKANKVLFLVR